MMKQIVKKFFGKAVIFILAIAMTVSAAWLFEGEASVAYATEGAYFITESQTGLTITENMTAPKPTTEGKETYIFAGYYAEETCETPIKESTDGTVYKKFVPAEIMSVKAQVTKGTAEDSDKTDMRLVTTVDGLNYKEVGFDVYFNGATTPVNAKTTTVYKRIIAADNGNAFGYSPEAFDTDSEYFTTVNLVNIANKNFDKTFFVKPYWKTLDGTKVYGLSRMARVSDSYNGIANVPVRIYADSIAKGNAITATYDSVDFTYQGFDIGNVDAGATVAVNGDGTITCTTSQALANVNDMLVNLRFKINDTASSNERFDMVGTGACNYLYKVFSTSYNGTPDTSWYVEFKDEKEFVVSTPADLYGLAEIVNDTEGDYKTEQFSGDTIKLGADITINTATLDPESDATSYIKWTPIGKTGAVFNGTFDGRGNKISGIYVNMTANNAGLFGVASGSTIQDLEIKNSCFNSTKGVLGSVVGYATNTKFMNIRSNAYVIGGAAATGGIVGSVDDASAEQNISNCWFDGNITGTTYCGGIVGRFNKGTSTISDCLVTGSVKGNVSGNTASVGGIVGGMPASNSPTLEISTSISVGSVEGVNAGGVIGYRASSSTAYATLTLNNLYTTHTKGIGTQSGTANPGNVKDTTNKSIDPSTLNGHVAYDTIKDGLSVLTSQVKDGAWAIREQSSNLKDGVPVPVAFADEWIDVAWYYDAEKSDDKGETYSIGTAEELYGFSAISQDYNFEGDTIQLENDITANTGKASAWATGTTTPNRVWTPIGNETTKFQGTFDGQGHEIKGIYASGSQYVGLFGYTSGATLQKFRLTNSYIHATSSRAGSIAGCHTGDMSEIYSDALVVSTSTQCGGLVGYYTGDVTDTISKCWFAGTVQGSKQTGGIIGTIAMGNKTIQNCLVSGNVKTTDTSDTTNKNGQVGGIIGSIANYDNLVVNVISSLNTGKVEDGYEDVKCGGIVGYRNAKGVVSITDVYTTYTRGIGTQSGTNKLDEDEIIKIDEIDNIKGEQVYTNNIMNLGYYLYDSTWVARTTDIPVPRCFVGTVVDENDIVEDISAHTAWYDADSDATEFEIKTENDLLGFAEIVNASEGTYAAEQFSGKTVKLAKDMDLNRGWNAPETVDDAVDRPDITWTPIGNDPHKFQGTFDGQGHEIKGIYADGSQYVGLFGYTNGATLRKFRLTNSYVHATSTRVGSIVGCHTGEMSEIYSDALVVSTSTQCGGLVGYYTGNVTDTISKCWFAGTVQGSKQTGGIIGTIAMGNKTIENCLVSGNVKTTDTSDTTNKNGQVGGMIGSIASKDGLVVNVISSLSTGDVEDGYQSAKCGGIVGYRNATNQTSFDAVYTTYTRGIGTQSSTNKVDEGEIIKIANIDNIKGAQVYDEEKGIKLNYAVWIARINDVPVPRCFVGSIVAAEDTVEDNSGRVYIDTDWYDDNPDATVFDIDTAHELAGLAQLVNDGITFDNKTINLVKDIDFNKGWTAPATTADEVVNPVNTWMPIGNSSSASFQGTFNGNGNTISGIYVDENVETTYTGLFGYTKTCAVKDLRLENSYFSTTNPYMGSIIGYGNGTLTNVYSDAIMHSTNIEVGGLVGRGVKESNSESSKLLNMTGCWFEGDIRVVPSAANAYVGGLVGYVFTSDAIIDACLYTGDITLVYTSTTTSNPNTRSGGIIGAENGTNAYATISNTISAGTITGIMEGTATAINNLCTTIGQVRSASTVCTNVYDMSVVTKVIGSETKDSRPRYGNTSGTTNASNISIDQTYDKEDIFGLGAQLLTTLDFVQDAEETIWAARRGQIPAPAGLVADSDKLNVQFGKADQEIADGATGDTAEDPYIIENVEELYGFAILSRTDNFAGKFIKLSDDIDVLDLNPGESAEDWAKGTAASLPWYSIGTSSNRFAGHFDGNGKTISGIYMNQDNSYLGLFAATETGSTISNLRLTNSYINYTGNGTAYTGSVVGDLRGDMTEVYSDAIINSNGTQTGGLIGQVNATSETVYITNCWYDGQLTSSKSYAGGLLASVAKGTVNVDNCLNTGYITTTYNNENNAAAGICAQVTGASVVTITDTIAAGKITDANHGKNVKSVVGYVPNGTVNFENVFATKFAYGRALPSEGASGAHTGTVIRTHKANRLIGYCVGEIKTGETGPKLDFTADWTIRTSDVPVPTCFADLVTPVAVAEESTLEATLNAQIGLDTLGLSVANAIDMGEGNYVLETIVDDTSYSNYVAKLEGDLGFGEPVAENSAGAGADGLHSVSYKKQNPDWVLTLTYVESTDVLTISINTDIDSLSDNLVYTEGVEDEDYMATGDITFSMLQMKEYTVNDDGKEMPVDAIYADLTEFNSIFKEYNSYWYGNSFVFQLPNGHFIVNDGGARQEFADLVTYLKTAAGTTEDGKNPVYIDAWIVSHQHGDHFDVIRAASDALRDESSDLMDNIYVDAFYINEPNAKVLANASLDDDVDSQYNGMTLFTKGPDGEQADIYRMQTGQRYYFNGLVMDVIQAQEQIPYSKYGKYNASSSDPDFNTVSTVTLFTTSNQQKILIGGDANYANMQYIMDAYGIENDYTKSGLLKNINVFVAFHHGKNMSMNINGAVNYSFIDYLTKDGSQTGHLFDYVLYPCSLVYDDDSDPAYAFPNAGEANEYLNTKVKNNNYKHYGDDNVVITLPGATTE